jgi:hypothetical protein
MDIHPNEVDGPTTDAPEEFTQKTKKAAKPPKKPIEKAIKADIKGGDVKIFDIPEKRAKRIEEINADMAAYRSAYNTRMHEILVGICDDLDIGKDKIAEYTPDFKGIIVKSDQQQQSPPPLRP